MENSNVEITTNDLMMIIGQQKVEEAVSKTQTQKILVELKRLQEVEKSLLKELKEYKNKPTYSGSPEIKKG